MGVTGCGDCGATLESTSCRTRQKNLTAQYFEQMAADCEAEQRAEDEFNEYMHEYVLPYAETIKRQIEHLDELEELEQFVGRSLFKDVCRQLLRDKELPFREWIGEEQAKRIEAQGKAEAVEAELNRRVVKAPTRPQETESRLKELVEQGLEDDEIAEKLAIEKCFGARGEPWTPSTVGRTRRKLRFRPIR